MSDEGRQLRQLEGRRTENSVDSNGGHVARVAQTARTYPGHGEASPLWVGQRRWHPNWLNDGPR